MKPMLVFSSTDSTPLRLTKSDADVYKVQNSKLHLARELMMQLWNISGTGMMMIIWRWGWCLTLKNSVFFFCWWTLFRVFTPSNAPHCSTFCSVADHQIIIRRKEGFFFPPTSATESLQSQWPQRHLDVPEKGCWHETVMLLWKHPQTWLSRPEAEDGAVSAWCRSPTQRQAGLHWVPSGLQCDCGSNRAETPGGALSCIQPQRSRAIPASSALHKPGRDELDSLVRSQRLSFSSSRVFFLPSFTGWRGCVRRRWWRRGWSGPRRTPEPPAVPCPSLPPGTPPPPPRLRGEKTHIGGVNTHSE